MYDTYNESLTKSLSNVGQVQISQALFRLPRHQSVSFRAPPPFPLHARGGLVAAIRNLFRELEIAPTPEILGPVCAKIHSILNPGLRATKKKDSLTLTFHFWLFNRDPFFGNGFLIKSHITRCVFYHCNGLDLLTFQFRPSGVAKLSFAWRFGCSIWGVLLAKKTKRPTKPRWSSSSSSSSFSASQQNKVTTLYLLLHPLLSQSVETLDSIIALPNSKTFCCRRDSHFCKNSM